MGNLLPFPSLCREGQEIPNLNLLSLTQVTSSLILCGTCCCIGFESATRHRQPRWSSWLRHLLVARMGLHYASKWPLVSGLFTFLGDYDITHLQVSFWVHPLFAFLKLMQKLLPPSHPKLIGQVLDTSPPFAGVDVFLEPPWVS